MIVLFTDFGFEGPYTGQMKAALYRLAPDMPVIDLMADAPPCDPKSAAYLLAAFGADFPKGSVFLGVVDPGVGGDRRALALELDGRWFVGPDNGLFEIVARRAERRRLYRIDWRPGKLAPTFHGRDLFAPVAAAIARLGAPAHETVAEIDSLLPNNWPDDLPAILYVDRFGNAMTGLRAARLAPGTVLEARGHRFGRANTFADLPPGEGFWYENSSGLAEIAVNRGRADHDLGLVPGTLLTLGKSS